MKDIVEIFTDGACKGNPGVGGWGAILRYNQQEKEIYGSEPLTTNNRMELTAAIKALECLKRPCKVILTTDSEYMRKGMTEWLPGWQKRGWRKSNGDPVVNADLWMALQKASEIHQIEWLWVKGHSGHPENHRADELANLAIQQMLKEG